jgi:hypothetical protein
MISTFLHFIRKKINPLPLSLPLQKNIYASLEYKDDKEETMQSNISDTIETPVENLGTEEPWQKYIGIDNNDLSQRVQHNICNLIGLDTDELAFIEGLDCKHMFEIVLLLNKAVVALVDDMN